MKTIKLIGGLAHGKRVDVPDDIRHYVVRHYKSPLPTWQPTPDVAELDYVECVYRLVKTYATQYGRPTVYFQFFVAQSIKDASENKTIRRIMRKALDSF